MSTSPLVSIIVAVYNIQDYLAPCLSSILSQTYPNIEIIIINDGSTDKSLKILKGYQKKYPRIKIITQKNSGLSAVRNRGLKSANGEYICFIDGDDYLDPNYIKHLVSAITKSKADISVCGFNSVRGTNKTAFTPKSENLSGLNATIRLLVHQNNLDIVTWNKLYRTQLFLKNKITFPLGQLHEDNLTTYKLYSKSKKVAFIGQPLYYYCERSDSIMGQAKELNRLKIRYQAARAAISYLTNPDLKDAAKVSLLLAYLAYLDASLKNRIPKAYATKSISWITKHANSYRSNPHLTPKLRIYLFMITHFNARFYKVYRKIK